VANDGDAWTLALAEVRATFARVTAVPPADDRDLVSRALAPPGAQAAAVGRFLPLAETLGRRTGEVHLALAAGGDLRLAPEPLTAADRRALVARARAMLDENLATLAHVLDQLPPAPRGLAARLLDAPQVVAGQLDQLAERPLAVVKTRVHGDLHLGQVLVRGDDFMIIDFEGEPSRPLAERRAKSSPLRDVMAMVRSFDYAPEAVLREPAFADSRGALAPMARWWTREVSASYLRGYLATVADAPFVPRRRDELAILCTFYQLEKVIYELGYEANNRPDWLEIPVRGLASLAGIP
jgi:maltose alpha-D-glucosyltransferase/alpha-amylase